MAKESPPWMSVSVKTHEVRSIQALWDGVANENQQKIAVDFILEVLCRRLDMSFRPGPEGDRETVFAEGRRFVGNQLVRIAKLKVSEQKES